MTSGLQPINSGAPQPVQGVTGGPGLPQGVASVDGTTGNVQISPPSNTIQQKKGASPQSFQVYEFDAGTTNYSRVAINAQTGGPFQLAVETQPPSLIRGLNVSANGALGLSGSPVNINSQAGTMNITSVGLLSFGTSGNTAISIQTNGLVRWSITNAGILQPATNNNYDIGTPAISVRAVYVTSLNIMTALVTTGAVAGTAQALPSAPAGYFLVADSTGTFHKVPCYN